METEFMSEHRAFDALRGLYRDRENGWIFGVCAGLAERFGLRTAGVRIVTLACLIFWFWPTVLVYGVAALLLRDRPLAARLDRERERALWGSHRCGRHS